MRTNSDWTNIEVELVKKILLIGLNGLLKPMMVRGLIFYPRMKMVRIGLLRLK